MRFELEPVLIDRIIFCMEDQGGRFLLDTRSGVVVNQEEAEAVTKLDDEGEGRFVPLPVWGPAKGFRLRERFAAALRNALVREELSAALDSGRGVFRAFKETLSRYPETEKRWFAWKEREMRREVISWYNALREQWGLSLIGEEPEDIAGLALEDFRFRAGTAADTEEAAALHRLCLAENAADEITSNMNNWIFPGDIVFTAESSGGEFAGYINAVFVTNAPAKNTLRICALELKPEYRGLGLGKFLTELLLTEADKKGVSQIIMDIPERCEYFSHILLRESFAPVSRRFCRKKPEGERG